LTTEVVVSELAVEVRPNGLRTFERSSDGMSWPVAFSRASPNRM
jgi:hypothetical protein